MFYCGDEYATLLKKYSGNVAKLNQAIKAKLTQIKYQDIQEDECELEMKVVYVGNKVNDDISQICMKKNITKAKLAQVIKEKLLLEKI